MLEKKEMSKRELTKRIGITFDEIENLLEKETLASMLMSQIVGGATVDGTFDACNDVSCNHGKCNHYDCSHGTCTDNTCSDSPKETQEPTRKPSLIPTPIPCLAFV